MMILKGDQIYLRALEPSDLEFLYELENDPEIWEVSGTITPYSKHVLKLYLENAHRDIYDVKQLRLCICNNLGKVLGLIDLFDFDPKNRRAGMGIIIKQTVNRNKGIGSEAIKLMIEYAFEVLNLHQIFVNVASDNKPSIKLFEKMGFDQAGIKKDWNFTIDGFKNEILFQKIKK
ncbi:GNAT family N-acetyltransferase [Kriegella sp. EG-1]|nr:GNAT family N-acetyltransferase [Flavobacteriaceae bacterium EG-1]